MTGDLIKEIEQIAREASAIMKEREFSVYVKGDLSNLVTSSDIAVQKLLEARLTDLLPGSSCLGEEDTDKGRRTDYMWVLDPIDGTANYARDLGCSVISIALLKGGEQYLGVVYNPYRDEMYTAVKGEGAFLNGKKIHTSDRPYRQSMFCTAMSLYDKSLAGPCFEVLERVYPETDDLRRFGTAALEMCALACGRVELYFEIRLSSWDYAAATLILKEAGGYFEIMFNDKVNLDKPAGVFAANSRENFERLKAVINEVIPKPLY